MCLLVELKHITQTLLALMVDLDIPMQPKFISKLTVSRGQPQPNNTRALRHLTGTHLPGGQQSILDVPVPDDEVAAAAKARAKAKARPEAKPPPEPKGPPPERSDRWQGRERRVQQRQEQSSSSSSQYHHGQRRWRNDQWE